MTALNSLAAKAAYRAASATYSDAKAAYRAAFAAFADACNAAREADNKGTP